MLDLKSILHAQKISEGAGCIFTCFSRTAEDPGSMFFELISCEDESKPAIPAWEAEIGSSYHLIVTSYGGLCRCRIGDTVLVHAMYGKMPIVSVLEDNKT